MLFEYGVEKDVMYCGNMSTIIISKNHVQHSKTKHINIRHHFTKKFVEKKINELKHVSTEKQLTNIFTKPLESVQFETLKSSLGLRVTDNLFSHCLFVNLVP